MLVMQDGVAQSRLHSAIGEKTTVLDWVKSELQICNAPPNISALGLSLDDVYNLVSTIDAHRSQKGGNSRMILTQSEWPACARQKWMDIMHCAEGYDMSVSLRNYDFPPSFSIVCVNNKIVAGSYQPHLQCGGNTFIMVRRGSGSTFDTFMSYFNSLWDNMTNPLPYGGVA